MPVDHDRLFKELLTTFFRDLPLNIDPRFPRPAGFNRAGL
ncbi:hypothetical protein MOTHE_c06160 [Moorella thermoacetica]|jgi:hypothetical protein|uniref:Uncharacterized protein n=2 Tax=Neomoorella thermoacetica TaxID=1525 RepID=A0A1J5N2H0_NEOTH|nr:hypothetical protein MOTHE_c06160 [Moorella thermoacetica]GAF26387.1 hypothetical protein MTY_1727 [Moorella thermoacetica Y72]GEA16583.1 hypothetical protein E308F_28290 [Moorella sp. E308F]AKX96070.1 hypothetical protein MOTHA_c07130 [Moorella thermoacetica]OIQ09931.1 hypothetical protein MOOR_07730 [Moorella thermoacetica]